ncbi:hypothetical protein [Acinetobacter bereziniae]|uniref:hypothetical protein n=1 Tax=Acinetobacter bereziniae TaxID=106648 RepID=UPI0030093286
MSLTLAQIRAMVQSGNFAVDLSTPLYTSIVSDTSTNKIEYSIYMGWDLIKANHIDESWGDFKAEVAEFLLTKNFDSEILIQIEQNFNFGDDHWDWFEKSAVYRSDEYKWFFLYAEGKPQAVCLIYHPKQSILSQENIFYIEYIAVAPWNRKNPMAVKKFAGLGELLIRFIVNYACQNLGLTLGFSLHSLPGAMGFYQSIGMQNITTEAKDGLEFFEMPSEVAGKYLEAS